MEFVSLVPPVNQRPKAAWFGEAKGMPLLRDVFTIQTWLALGATLQGLAYLILGRMTLLPAFLYLFYCALDTYAMATGWKRNTRMDKVLHEKFSAQIASPSGSHGSKPANNDIVVLLIGTRYNHPLGPLAPGAKEIGDFFTQMARDLEAHAEEFGFLGMTSWLNASDRTTHNEIMSVAYFRSVEGLHAFAHSEYHRDGWDWWTKTYRQHPHLSIFHEVYHAPKGNWETIYINSHASGLASTTSKVEGKDVWVSPVVNARSGLLKTSAGRMQRSAAKEHEAYGEDPY